MAIVIIIVIVIVIVIVIAIAIAIAIVKVYSAALCLPRRLWYRSAASPFFVVCFHSSLIVIE